MQQRVGFTLIELSMVLVIIGLIIGGVLVGRTLISAAEMCAQITQIEQFKTAINTFRTKYNAIPGDMPAATAAAVGMTQCAGTSGHGDGNGFLESCGTQDTYFSMQFFGCETALILRDLSDAGLITGTFTGDTDNFIEMDPGQQEQFIPAAKLGNLNFIAVFGGTATAAGGGAFNIHPGYAITFALVYDVVSYAPNFGMYGAWSGITPGQAFAIDTKTDDGMPATGAVLASNPTGLLVSINNSQFANTCAYLNGSTYEYQLTASTVDQPGCIMNFVIDFGE